MKILNIYGQYMEHEDVKIIGNAEGLTELRDTINNVLQQGHGGKAKSLESKPLFASDGEGYSILVECYNDEWGIDAPPDSFWNKSESNPEYGVYNAK